MDKLSPAIHPPYPEAGFFSAYGHELSRAWKTLDLWAVERAASVLRGAYTSDARVFTCGNGGSASIANHFECDHVKGIRSGARLIPRVMSLSNSIELLTAIGNDISYSSVFTYQLQSHASPGDVLVAISSSGNSANIVAALIWAREHGLRTIALTGFDGGTAGNIAEISIHTACDNYGIIEDVHQGVMHALAQFIAQSA